MPGSCSKDFRAWAQEPPRRIPALVVRRDEAGAPVGRCGLRGVDSAARSAELGIELRPGEWGRYGYAIEVMRALAKFGFEELSAGRALRQYRECQCTDCAPGKLAGSGREAARYRRG